VTLPGPNGWKVVNSYAASAVRIDTSTQAIAAPAAKPNRTDLCPLPNTKIP
jgi:hypothetical protein